MIVRSVEMVFLKLLKRRLDSKLIIIYSIHEFRFFWPFRSFFWHFSCMCRLQSVAAYHIFQPTIPGLYHWLLVKTSICTTAIVSKIITSQYFFVQTAISILFLAVVCFYTSIRCITLTSTCTFEISPAGFSLWSERDTISYIEIILDMRLFFDWIENVFTDEKI